MSHSDRRDRLIEQARQYFVRSDAGREDTLDLFHEDIRIWFPKLGVVRGKAGFLELAQGLLGSVDAFAHDREALRYFADGDTVIVEGTTIGRGKNGIDWKGGETPGGRFCSIFEFDGDLIVRMHIYLDPDYTSQDEARFLWGRGPGRRW